MSEEIPVNWQEAWAKRKEPIKSDSVLAVLMSLSGAKERFQKTREENWLQLVQQHCSLLGLGENDSVYELGSGAGAWLYPLYITGHKVGGLDFSPFLVEVSRQYLPNGPFSVQEAIECQETPCYDMVVAKSTFSYFPDYGYAEKVVGKMVRKARKKVGIFAIPDLARRDATEKYRRGTMSPGEYDRLYKNLPRLYYPVSLFVNAANKLGAGITVARPAPDSSYYSVILDALPNSQDH